MSELATTLNADAEFNVIACNADALADAQRKRLEIIIAEARSGGVGAVMRDDAQWDALGVTIAGLEEEQEKFIADIVARPAHTLSDLVKLTRLALGRASFNGETFVTCSPRDSLTRAFKLVTLSLHNSATAGANVGGAHA